MRKYGNAESMDGGNVDCELKLLPWGKVGLNMEATDLAEKEFVR